MLLNKIIQLFLFLVFAGVAGTVFADWLPQNEWGLFYVDSEEKIGENGGAANAFDGNTTSVWHTEWLNSDPPCPHEIQINLGGNYKINGFKYLPRQDGVNGRIAQYEFYVSSDGIDWGDPVASGTFENDITEKEVSFSPAPGRLVRLVALSEVNGNPWTSVAEINVSREHIVAPADSMIPAQMNVTWDYEDPDSNATGFDLRINGNNDSLLRIPANDRSWSGEILLMEGTNSFDLRAVADIDGAEAYSVWSYPAYYEHVPPLKPLVPPGNLTVTIIVTTIKSP